MDSISPRIGTFKDFLHSKGLKKKKHRLDEENLSIECDWYDRSIVEVMQRIDKETYVGASFDEIVKYLKIRKQVLSDTLEYSDEELILQHIKELIWYNHGGSIVLSDNYDETINNHSMGLVISELSQKILNKIKERKNPDASQATPTASITDAETTLMIPVEEVPVVDRDEYEDGEYYDDPSWQYESKKVLGYEKFSRMLNEANNCIKLTNNSECLEKSITRITEDVGDLQLENILKYINGDSKNKNKTIYNYIWDIVADIIDKEGNVEINYKGNDLGTTAKDMLKQVIQLQISMIVEEILVAIYQKSGMTSEKIK